MSHEDVQLHEVRFLNAAPKNIRVYEQYFQCPVRFSQPRTELLIPMEIRRFSKPLSSSSPHSAAGPQAKAFKVHHSAQIGRTEARLAEVHCHAISSSRPPKDIYKKTKHQCHATTQATSFYFVIQNKVPFKEHLNIGPSKHHSSGEINF